MGEKNCEKKCWLMFLILFIFLCFYGLIFMDWYMSADKRLVELESKIIGE